MASQSKHDGSEPLDIDPNGDLILEISIPPVKRLMRVSSKILCLTSSVFREMLELSRFQEGAALQTSTGENPAKIVLNEGDYDALLIIMNAMHLRARQVPTTVAIDVFYNIAVLCDTYSLAEALVPWVNIWTNGFSDIVETPGYEKWLLISWVFGQSKIFRDVTKKLILNTELVDGLLKTDDCDELETQYTLDDVIGDIRNMREQLISALISIFVKEMEKYHTGALSGRTICQLARTCGHKRDVVKKRKQCDNICAGTLYRHLVTAEMWPEQTRAEGRAAVSIYKDYELMEGSGEEIGEGNAERDEMIGFTGITHGDCDPKKRIMITVSGIFSKVQGLDLDDYFSEDFIYFPEEDKEVAAPPEKKQKIRC